MTRQTKKSEAATPPVTRSSVRKSPRISDGKSKTATFRKQKTSSPFAVSQRSTPKMKKSSIDTRVIKSSTKMSPKSKVIKKKVNPRKTSNSDDKAKQVVALRKKIREMQKEIKTFEDSKNKQDGWTMSEDEDEIAGNVERKGQKQRNTLSADSRDNVMKYETKNKKQKATSKTPEKKTATSKKKTPSTEPRKRKLETSPEERSSGQKVAYFHVGEGGAKDLEEHVRGRGTSKVNIQVVATEQLPDIDESDMIHGLDPAGTSRDYVDEGHRCTVRCPVGCQGHLRPNEIIIYESTRYEGRLLQRTRTRGRFVESGWKPGDVVALEVGDFKRVGRGSRRRAPGSGRPAGERRRARPARQPPKQPAAGRKGRAALVEPQPSESVSVGPVQEISAPQRLSILLDSPPVTRDEAEAHGWNENDRSFNIVLKEDDPLTMRRHPVAQSTDCIRGKVAYSTGLHLWEVTWPVRQRGTHAVIGVATREAVLHNVGYQSLVGNTVHSWGWDLGRKKAFHDCSGVDGGTFYPASQQPGAAPWHVPDIFNMVLDMDVGRLGFVVGNQFLGWAHTNLKQAGTVFPIVSTVWGHCEVKLKYLGGRERGTLALMDLARSVIRDCISRDREELVRKVETLYLPTALKNYIKYY